jgi:nucleoside-diphosphate-sugar epimerase
MKPDFTISANPRILITGGSGFLGRAITEELFSNDSPLAPSHVRILDIKDSVEITTGSIEYIKGDIRNDRDVEKACRGMDVVIHSAAIVDWGTHPGKEVYEVNVTGTENVIRACHKTGVSCLVFTSSLDAVFGGKPLVDIDETYPYPETHPNMYCRSKYLAEKHVIKACTGLKGQVESRLQAVNRKLQTVILRPADIWGERDPYHVGSLINMAKSGFYVRLGNGEAKCQHTYVRNAAYAHVLAARALWTKTPGVDGEIFFITDGTGSNFFTFFDRIVEGAGYRFRPRNLWIPRRLAYAIGAISEGIAWVLQPVKKYTPKFSRFAVIYTCSNFTFSSKKASEILNYYPKYSDQEAFALTTRFFREH